MEPTQSVHERIGGVLIFIALLLVLNPIRIAFVFATVSVPASSLIPSWFANLEVIATGVFFLYSVIVPVYFFQKRKIAPILVIILFLFNMFFVAVNGTITQWIPDDLRHGAGEFRMREFVAGAIWFLLWTTYFMTSKRVKSTFIR
jgi:hypothetical protein